MRPYVLGLSLIVLLMGAAGAEAGDGPRGGQQLAQAKTPKATRPAAPTQAGTPQELFAAAAAGNTTQVKRLLAQGVDPNSTGTDGWTPLMAAALNGRVTTVETLIAAGAKLDALSSDGATPLMAATLKGHTDVVGLLIAKGADVTLKNQDGVTALIIAEQKGQTRIADLLRSALAVQGEEAVRRQAEIAAAQKRVEEAARRLPATVQRRGNDNAERVYIPAGTFTMGDSHGDGDPNEKPTHQVTITAFWLDRTEVTNAQFARFVLASSSKPQEDWLKYAAGKTQHPVVEVTWHDAVAYCTWADKRLPTEAEWEYAARGTDGRKYPWGNTWEDTRGRFGDNKGDQTTAPVGSYPTGASPFGAFDLAGNVGEWTSSLDKPYPYVATDGRENPTASGYRVIRGGSWVDDPRGLRSAGRDGGDPAFRGIGLGFRCAQGVQ